MSATYTVTDIVGEPREWQSRFGPMLSYTLALKDVEGVVELSQKPDRAAPKAGEQIAGDIEPSSGSFPPKLKREKREGGFNGGGMSPEREKRITRLHSQEMAIRVAASAGLFDEVDLREHAVVGDALKHLRKLIDWFDKDAGV